MLGSWLVKALLERDEDVVVLRRRPRPHSALVLEGAQERCTVVDGDLLDEALLARAIAEHDVRSVFHLAAQPLVARANAAPAETFEVNVRGTWLLLEACRAHDVAGVVVASSDKVYGPIEQHPYLEDAQLIAGFPYDVSKAAADLIARSYHTTYGLPVATTRFTNVYGGGDGHGSRLIPDAVAAALAGRDPVIRSDGSPRRDFLYVEDAVAGYVAIADGLTSGRNGVAGEAFNGGAGQTHTVREVVECVCRLVGGGVRPDVRGESTPGELRDQEVDASKLREVTGWAPRIGLEEGLGQTIAWYREHPSNLAS
ncbi:MAG: GDP-mannose 4,6-dehydratase [Solirubrobacterales bacterium]|nr:GDP-mannose 4,6-dehydratase [Solirubrobacterales bacterium]